MAISGPAVLPPTPDTVTHILGVKFDNELSFRFQVDSVIVCFRLLRILKYFFFLLPAQCQKMVIHAVITLRLDYASALYWSFLKYQLETPASTECCSLTPAKSLEI